LTSEKLQGILLYGGISCFFQQDLLLFADIFYCFTNFWQLFKWGKKKRARTHAHTQNLSLSLSLSLSFQQQNT
jgi:hypothetical protein